MPHSDPDIVMTHGDRDEGGDKKLDNLIATHRELVKAVGSDHEAVRAITRRCVGPDEHRVAQFLAEQTADSMHYLSEQQPALLNAGALVLRTAGCVAELAMVLGPMVFRQRLTRSLLL